MKICISGAHGTGKTTLVDLISKRLDIPKIPEIIRGVYQKLDLPKTNLLSLKDRLRSQEIILNIQYIIENQVGSYISDRSVIDTICYIESYGGIVSKQSHQDALRHMKNFDMIFIPSIVVVALKSKP